MNRRTFLSLAPAALAGFALDPERALWVPGRTSYFDIVRPGLRRCDLYVSDGINQYRMASGFLHDDGRLDIPGANFEYGYVEVPGHGPVRIVYPEDGARFGNVTVRRSLSDAYDQPFDLIDFPSL
jgi:hypothetical protein